MIAHVLRFWPEYVEIARRVASGELGRPRSGFASRRQPFPAWSALFSRSDLTGGAVIDMMIHDYDALNWVFVSDAGLRVLNDTDLASRAEVVVVAGTEDLVYDDLRQATLAVRRGADFLATGRDPTYPQQDGLWPGTGAILAAVEYASGRSADIVGKPQPQLLYTALDRLGDGRTLVVGDRVDTDLGAAAAAQLDAALVLSGGAHAEDVDGLDPPPVAVAATLADLMTP